MDNKLKIAVMNFSGNVGKTTVSRHLLAPRLNNASVVTIESINKDGSENTEYRGKQFGKMLESMGVLDQAVVDVGASNVEDFIHLMKQYDGSHEEFDYFVVPTVASKKQQRDTITTIEALAEIGIPAEKIRVVFNMVESDEVVERIFSSLFLFHKEEKSFSMTPAAQIHMNDIFGQLRPEQSINQILNDPTDYRELRKSTEDAKERLECTRAIGLKRLATGVTSQLDNVFEALLA